MQIDPKVLIAGQKPAALKVIFRGGGFHVDWFTEKIGKTSDNPGATLASLAAEGWVEPDPGGEGWWQTTKKADRLVSTPLLPRLQVRRARELVGAILAEAESVNSDSTHFLYVEQLSLFGSTLTADLTGTVGDIDVGYTLSNRGATQAEGQRLWDADLASRPVSYRSPPYSWPSERILRRLKVERRVSLHTQDEVDREGFGGAAIYRFDLATGRGATYLPWERGTNTPAS